MASSKEYLDFVLEQVSDLSDITDRAMMGEYILYYRGKIVGGIYDDRLLVKPVKAAHRLMPEAVMELPYEGAKEMLPVLKEKGYEKTSLAVQKANYAVKLYQRAGFEIVDENEEEYIMVCRLR